MKKLAATAWITLLSLSFSAFGQANPNKATMALIQTDQASLLKATEVANILPPTVFFQGRTAPIQGRNSGGIRFGDKSLMLIALVDSSGYSSEVQERYQAYLITESAIDIDGHRLAAGAYGCGFLSNNAFIVMDIGGHELFTAHATHDENLHRPTPLQIMASPNEPGKYRLYGGRNFVVFRISTGS
jgi:hypothetical protein